MEILRRIGGEEPQPLRQLNAAVPRDLETILLKAMAKEPGGRYPTAKDLADELRRFLEHKPITARRPSLLDRAAKLSRRNRPVVWSAGVSLAVLLLMTIAGLATSNVLIARERDQKDAALAQRGAALADAQANESAARANLRLARRAVDELYTQLIEEMHELSGIRPLQQKVMLRALAFYKEFDQQKGADPEIRFETARGYLRTGHIHFELGQYSEAEQGINKGIALFERLVEEFPDEARYTAELANAYCSHFVVPDGQAGSGYGDPSYPIQQVEMGIKNAIRLYQKLVADHPEEARYRDALVNAYYSLGYLLAGAKRYEEAESAFRQVLTSGPAAEGGNALDRRSLFAAATGELGRVLAARGQTERAEEAYRRAAALYENIMSEFPEARGYQAGLARALTGLATILQQSRRPEDAVRAANNAVELLARLAARWPDDRPVREQFAGSQHVLARSLIAASRDGEAIAAYREAIRLVPEQGMFNNDLAWLLVTAPDPKLHDPATAVRLAQIAVEQRPKRANVWNTLGVARYRAGNFAGAAAALEKSEELGQGRELGFNVFFLAMARWQLGERDEARRCYDQAVSWMEKNQPRNEELRRFRAEAAVLLGLPEPAPPITKEVPTPANR